MKISFQLACALLLCTVAHTAVAAEKKSNFEQDYDAHYSTCMGVALYSALNTAASAYLAGDHEIISGKISQRFQAGIKRMAHEECSKRPDYTPELAKQDDQEFDAIWKAYMKKIDSPQGQADIKKLMESSSFKGVETGVETQVSP
jgi:hypothetical protein